MEFSSVLTDSKSREEFAHLLKSEGLCYEDLDNIFGSLQIARSEKGEIIGGYGIEVFGKNALLRSVIVSKKFRNSGRGVEILDEAIFEAKKNNISSLYLLTNTAEDFFSKFGFTTIHRSSVPDSIGKTTEFETFCPDTAVCMKLKLI